jgi:hypothetical protein
MNYLIDDERVLAAIVHAENVCNAPEVYLAAGDYSGHASVDAIYAYVQTKSNVPIHLWDVSFEGRRIGSRIERYNDRIEISINSSQDDNWKRFCAVKELAHIIIDNEADFSPYGNDRINELLDQGLIGLASGANPTGHPTQSELVAEIAAIEILYPAIQISKDLAEHQSATLSQPLNVRRVALERHMPDFYASTALHPQFRTYIKTAVEQCMARRE